MGPYHNLPCALLTPLLYVLFFSSRRLMCTSELAFSVALDAGALPLVTNLTQDSSDVLLQLNALDLLEKASRGERHVQGISSMCACSIGFGAESGASATPNAALVLEAFFSIDHKRVQLEARTLLARPASLVRWTLPPGLRFLPLTAATRF